MQRPFYNHHTLTIIKYNYYYTYGNTISALVATVGVKPIVKKPLYFKKFLPRAADNKNKRTNNKTTKQDNTHK